MLIVVLKSFFSIVGRVYCATESSCSRKNGRLESSLRAEIGEKVLFLKAKLIVSL